MRKYDDDFKQQTLKKVFDGQAVASVAREIGVNESLIHKWKREALRNGMNGSTGSEVQELAVLKKRLRELEMENEILKKAATNRAAEEVNQVSFY